MSAVAYASTNEPKIFALEAQLVQDLPAACKSLVIKLIEQPLFRGYGSPRQKCKILPLKSKRDATIWEIFNRNLRKKRSDTPHCDLIAYGTGHHSLYEEDTVQPLSHGITLWLDDQYEHFHPLRFEETVCPLNELENRYSTIILQMTQGWISADPKEYRRIVHKENPEIFALFIKEKRLKSELKLISAIAEKFRLKDDIKCSNLWLDSCMRPQNEKLYFWIRISSLDRVVQKFGFSFIHQERPLTKDPL